MRCKTLLALIAFALPATADIPVVRKPLPERQIASGARSKGAWYFSREGHAVFCYGPTMYIQTDKGLQRAVTFCRGDKVIVLLRD
jgi:hypothetical protein